MLLLMGKTCAGKDTVQNILISKFGMKNVISYTTRPMRVGETNGVQYWFITEEEFLRKVKEGFFAEVITYKDKNRNTIYYGGAKEDFSDEKVMIVNVDGLAQIREFDDINSVAFFLNVSNEIIHERLIGRGDDEETARSRVEQDNKMFAGIEDKVEFVLDNENVIPDEMAIRIYNLYQSYIKTK